MNPELPPLPQLPLAGEPQLQLGPIVSPPDLHGVLPNAPEVGRARARRLDRLRRADDEVAAELAKARVQSQKDAEAATELVETRARMGERRYWVPDMVRWQDRLWWATLGVVVILATAAGVLAYLAR